MHSSALNRPAHSRGRDKTSAACLLPAFCNLLYPSLAARCFTNLQTSARREPRQQIAVLTYKGKEQLGRAASSVVLNLAEGRGRGTKADQKRFFQIAMGSVRECQAILDLSLSQNAVANSSLDRLVANLFCLIRSMA